MSYAKFLNRKEETVLAYLGGPFAYGLGRRVRVVEPRPAMGFHRFELTGRSARAIATAEPELDGLPKVRGHFVRGWIVSSELKARAERLHALPAAEPAPFSIVRARRWHSGDLVFESLDFDTEIEEAARLKHEYREPLGDAKGVPLSLRTAFGLGFIFQIAEQLGMPISVLEALAGAVRHGETEAAARQFLGDIELRRQQESDAARIRAIVAGRRPPAPFRSQTTASLDDAPLRAEAALDKAQARMLACRSVGDGNIEVTFEYRHQRFISVVDALTLHVYDSGVCLAGADELVTLESLPSVIRQAINEDRLVITRH